MTDTSDELRVFEGVRPSREGDLALESQGMAPIPEDNRYGGIHRMFTVWFTPNMELSGVFAGTGPTGRPVTVRSLPWTMSTSTTLPAAAAAALTANPYTHTW